MNITTRFCVVATLVAAVVGPRIAGAAPILGGHEYQLINAEGSTWTGANAAANSAGWYLATVTSAAENDFIIANLLQGLPVADRSHYWIGGTDAASEGAFAWVTGEAFGYTNWWGGEPNNVANEDYIAYDLRGGGWAWNDAPDNVGQGFGFARGYIMERVQSATVPEPMSLGLLGLGLLAVGVIRRKRT